MVLLRHFAALSLLSVPGLVTLAASTIEWAACLEELAFNPDFECAALPVPRDYTATENDTTINLELLRVPAAVQPSKGTILFNFGGPGYPGRSDLNGSAPRYRG